MPIALLALALVLATASRTPRTALPMLLLVRITGASLRLRAILLSKARIAALPLYSRKLISGGVMTRTYRPIFIYLTRCTDTGVIVTHALSFYRPLAPFGMLTHAQLAIVTQSCTLLYIAAHCDLLLQ